jgi:hypothetical protein
MLEPHRDQHDRLMRALNQKAAQTKAARAAWIWLEDCGALWPRTPFAASSLAEKIATLVDTLDMFSSSITTFLVRSSRQATPNW